MLATRNANTSMSHAASEAIVVARSIVAIVACRAVRRRVASGALRPNGGTSGARVGDSKEETGQASNTSE